MLVRAGADITQKDNEGKNAFQTAIIFKHVDNANYLRRLDLDNTKGTLSSNDNYGRNSLVMIATDTQYIENINQWVDLADRISTYNDVNGIRPVNAHRAVTARCCTSSSFQLVEQFLIQNANVDQTSHDKTPLMVAVSSPWRDSRSKIVDLLLAYGALIHIYVSAMQVPSAWELAIDDPHPSYDLIGLM